MFKNCFLLILLCVSGITQAQKLKKQDQQLVAKLQQHVQYLADDKLEGRRTGTKGEKLAAEYISNEFKKIGLQPKGTDSFYQPFDINEGKQISPTTSLVIDGKNLEIYKEFFPLAFSPNISIEALPSIALQEMNMPWFYDLKETFEQNAQNPHFDIYSDIIAKTKEFKKKGASALFIYNISSIEDKLKFNSKDRLEQMPIPVIYVTKEAAKKYLSDESATLDIKMKIDITEKKRTGTNVISFINNNAPNTVILGAHFDHLGYGEDGSSRETENKNQIHNGADDNASGIAALIELARILNTSKLKNNNYLFIAFSGEELGLFGSKYFTEHPTVDLNMVNYMINMDMLGRLDESSHTVTVGGYGTSPAWGILYNQTGKKKSLYNADLNFRYDSSGTGPSDHTSFYLKNIPVLFYFTGLHADYHKPSDDFEKINYNGEANLVKHIYSLIEAEDKQKTKIGFTKTRETQSSTSASFTVTLGVMPDYTFSGAGLRIDGISENRPAQRAGLKAGDVLISLGDYKITSMESYMQALAQFKKGDKTTVVYNRGNQTLSTNVEF